MKTVIFVLAALVAVNAQTCQNLKTYDQKLDPIVCPSSNMKLPNYEDASTYYFCSSASNATLTDCPTDTFFNMATQKCLTCSAYFPSEDCSSLKWKPTCVAIEAANTTTTAAPTTTTTAAPSTTTTAAPTTTTTEAPGESTTTTSGLPTPPTDAPATNTTASDGDDIITPSGTTQAVPQPPSPGDSNVPSPETPAPTAPVINDAPPTAPSAPSA